MLPLPTTALRCYPMQHSLPARVTLECCGWPHSPPRSALPPFPTTSAALEEEEPQPQPLILSRAPRGPQPPGGLSRSLSASASSSSGPTPSESTTQSGDSKLYDSTRRHFDLPLSHHSADLLMSLILRKTVHALALYPCPHKHAPSHIQSASVQLTLAQMHKSS